MCDEEEEINNAISSELEDIGMRETHYNYPHHLTQSS